MLWIPCNLPWSYHPAHLNLPTAPVIPLQRYLDTFQVDPGALRARLTFDVICENREKDQELLDKISNWESTQPEMIAFRDACREVFKEQVRLDQEAKERSFCGQELNYPGILVEFSDGRRLLLGHVDDEAKVGAGLPIVHPLEIVVRYMVLDIPGLEVVSENHAQQLQFRAANDVTDHSKRPGFPTKSFEERWGEYSGSAVCRRLGFRSCDSNAIAAKAAAEALEIYLAAYYRAIDLTPVTTHPK